MITTVVLGQLIVLSLLIVTQAKSIPKNIAEKGVAHRSMHKLWKPIQGNRADWLRCHGQPCDQWERVQMKLRLITSHSLGREMGWDKVIKVNTNKKNESSSECILFTEDQCDEILKDMEKEQTGRKEHSRYRRNLENFNSRHFLKWTFPIQWKFDGGHSASEQKIIRGATQHWSENTCVRFKEVDADERVHSNHILITKSSRGCFSYIGKVNIIPQQLNLQASCLLKFGVPVHEIGHALGLWHEQQRSDRNQHIRINWENLGSYISQFFERDTLNLVPYDYDSVMHYSPKDGSSNRKNVMESLDPLYQHNMGQRTGLSFLDAKIINLAYCTDICRNSPLPKPCQREGYQDPNDCLRCRCPDGLGGRYCDEVAPAKKASCGGEIQVSTIPQKIHTPGYHTRQYYPEHSECNWLFKAPIGHQLKLSFDGPFGLYCYYQQQCYHWVEVRYTSNLGMAGPRFCCYQKPNVTLTSETDEMLVVFKSNYSTWWQSNKRGFQATVVAVPRPGLRTTPKPTTPELPSTTQKTTTVRTTETSTVTTTVPTTSTVTTTVPSTSTVTTTVPTTTASTTTTQIITTTSVGTTTEAPPTGGLVWSCNFEGVNQAGSWCGIKQDSNDQFDWTLIKGRTPSYETGPESAYQGQYYIYIEASNPRRRDDTAVIFLPELKTQGDHCLTFHYHMFGFHINELILQQTDQNNIQKNIWNKLKQQDTEWHVANIDVSLNYDDQLSFVGVRGGEFSGDIALDGLELHKGRC